MANSSISDTAPANPQPTNTTGYEIHKISTAATNALKALINAKRSASEYQVYLSRYIQNPMDPVFGGPEAPLYSTNNPVGSFLRWALTPKPLQDLTKDNADKLRTDYAAPSSRFQMQLFKATNAIELTLNVASLAYGVFGDEEIQVEEGIVASLRIITSGSNFVGAHFQAKAFQMLSGTSGQTANSSTIYGAYKNLKASRQISFAMNLLQTAGGLVKVGIELKNAIFQSDDFSLSAFQDGLLTATSGASYAAYNKFLLDIAAKYAAVPSTATLALDTHWIRSTPIPRGTAFAMRTFGIIGPAISGAASSGEIYDGLTNVSLPQDVREHKVISGSMGFLSSLAFAASAAYMVPAGVVISTASVFVAPALLAVGLALLAGQIVYDEWGNIVYTASYVGEKVVDGCNYVANGVVSVHQAAVDGTEVAIEYTVDGISNAYEATTGWFGDAYSYLGTVF